MSERPRFTVEQAQWVADELAKVTRERDEARADLEELGRNIWQFNHDIRANEEWARAAEQDAARLARALWEVEDANDEKHSELRAALAAHDARVKGGAP